LTACPKKTNQKKGHPSFTSAFGGYLPLLVFGGTLKKLAALKQFLTTSPANFCDAQRERMGFKEITKGLLRHFSQHNGLCQLVY